MLWLLLLLLTFPAAALEVQAVREDAVCIEGNWRPISREAQIYLNGREVSLAALRPHGGRGAEVRMELANGEIVVLWATQNLWEGKILEVRDGWALAWIHQGARERIEWLRMAPGLGIDQMDQWGYLWLDEEDRILEMRFAGFELFFANDRMDE